MLTSVSSAAGAEPPAFPMPRTCPFDPPAEYAALRIERPVTQVRLPTGQLAWLVTRYEDVRRLLTDPRVSSDREHPNLPLTEPVTPESRRRIAAVGRSLIGLDPPEHAPRRRMLVTEFTVRRIQALRPHIQQVVDGCIDELLAGPRPADLVAALSLPVPSMVICELLGVPYSDREFFERCSTAQLRRSIPAEERQRTTGELRAYLDRLVTAKEAAPGEDLLGRLIVHNRETPVFDHELLVGLAMLLLVAGHESTANMISLGVVGLLEHPEQLAQITADPAAVDMAVEELLRYFCIVDAQPRVAAADIEIGGVTIPAGDGLLIAFAAANRDEEAFPAASTMDLGRGARNHVAFGYGIHQCLGQNLAREELQIVFSTLFARVPGLRLAARVEELPFKKDSNVYGIDQLPVTW
ncbi:MAG: cytochrome P450 [Actinobacteria bacterium]|nr:cytochrome P450 [Actinomycetota bacterium]MBI3686976.1 cytochrome P450 [Actinomycetota bacterium]